MPSVTLRNATDTWANGGGSADSKNYGGSTTLQLRSTDRYGYVFFNRAAPLGATITSAKLRLYHAGEWTGSRTITVHRIAAPWKVSRLTWLNKPGTTGSGVAVTDTGGPLGTLIELEVKTLLQAVSDGGAWYGFRISTSDATSRGVYAAEGLSAYRPTLEVAWTEQPDAPTTLSPSGNRAVSTSKPVLRFDFTDNLGDTTLAAVQVQITDDADWATPIYDTGEVAATDPELDLAAFGTNAITNPSFETDTTGWTGGGANATLARTTAQAYVGVASLQLTAIATSGSMFGYTASGYRPPVIEGQTYTGTARFRSAATARSTRVSFVWMDAAGGVIGSTVNGTNVTDSTTGWTLATLTAVAPAGAVTCRIDTVVLSPVAGEVHYVDDVRFVGGTTDWGGLSNLMSRYWRVRVKDGAGLWSDWSDDEQMQRADLGTITITNPPVSTVVSDPTPPILWSFAGGTQKYWQVWILDPADPSLVITQSGKQTGTDQSWTPPAKKLLGTGPFKLVVWVWDTVNREHIPNAPAYASATRTFTVVPDSTVNPVVGLAITQPSLEKPRMELTWTRSEAPDRFVVRRDGVVIEDPLLPEDALVSGTSYRFHDDEARVWREHTWQVQAVVNPNAASPGSLVTATPKQRGIWLLAKDRNLEVWLAGQEGGSWAIGEEASVFAPVGGNNVVRRVQARRGYEGSLAGTLVDGYGRTAAQYETDLTLMRDQPTKPVTLTLADLSIRVILGNVTTYPLPGHVPPVRVASFDFWQVLP